MQAVFEFLKAPTPSAWLSQAVDNIDILLMDHAHCEKKAASTALHLMFRYVDRIELLEKLAQLAREELLHFEQVLGFMQQKGVVYDHLIAAKYAQRLRCHIRKEEPHQLVDTLIIGAVIEARSCERFAALADHFERLSIHEDLVKYYRFLLKSESRHFQDYLELAQLYAKGPIVDRIDFFLDQEVIAITTVDVEFRFHSGAPADDLVSSNLEVADAEQLLLEGAI